MVGLKISGLPRRQRFWRLRVSVFSGISGGSIAVNLFKSYPSVRRIQVRQTLALMLGLALSAVCGVAQADEPHFRVEQRVISIHVNADGTSTSETYQVTSVLTDTGIEWYGEDSVYFKADSQSAQVLEAFTELPDGTRIELEDKAIRLVEGDSPGQGSYSQSKAHVVIFPRLVKGARTHLRSTLNEHMPLHKGEYSKTFYFSPTVHYEEIVINLSHDPAIELQIEVSDHEGAPVVKRLPEKAGLLKYRIEFTQTKRDRVEAASVEDLDIDHYVRISSIPDMLTVGKFYQQSAADKEAVTPEVQALADEITAGISDPLEQARALHQYVAREIRYVAIYLGDGGVVPNFANDIIRDRYGDCKDHNTLLIALLAAKGIEAESALINSGFSYTLHKLGGVAPFNHVVTYLPTWDLYVDSTDPYAPFGVLAYDTSDKPVVLTKSQKYARTPKVSPDENRTEVDVVISISPEGNLSGTTDARLMGATARATRAALLNYVGMYKDELARDELSAVGLVGTGSYKFEPMENLSNPVAYSAQFDAQPVTNFPGPGAMQVPVGLAPGKIARFGAFPPEPAHTRPYVCFSYGVNERYRLEFPQNVNVTRLPPERLFSSRGYTYRSSYRQANDDKRTVLVERKLVIDNPAHVCQPGDEVPFNELIGVIQADLRGQVFYEPASGQGGD